VIVKIERFRFDSRLIAEVKIKKYCMDAGISLPRHHTQPQLFDRSLIRFFLKK